jgi:hypothetical protein
VREGNWAPATEAYLWGYPLLSIQRTRKLLCSRTPPGVFKAIPTLATPRDRAVVVPNNDTLYASGWYDLRQGDLELAVPPMDHPGRYWNLMVVDAYTRVSYLRRADYGVGGLSARVTWDPEGGEGEVGDGVLRCATPTAWVIGRVLVESPEDLPRAQALQQGFVVRAPKNHPSSLTARGGRPTALAKTGADFFRELAEAAQADPPAPCHPGLSPEAKALLAGQGDASPAALEAGIAAGEALLKTGQGKDARVMNGWRSGRAAGGPGQDILKRALGAKFGLGGHYAYENRSYTAVHDAGGKPLDGRRPLQLSFPAGGFPPCTGFWSLTAYGADLYLVDNEIERYSLSDRTPGLRYDASGGLTVQLSAARPPGEQNWLPVPEGPYLLGLRVYEGLPTVVDCEWFPPDLKPKEP